MILSDVQTAKLREAIIYRFFTNKKGEAFSLDSITDTVEVWAETWIDTPGPSVDQEVDSAITRLTPPDQPVSRPADEIKGYAEQIVAALGRIEQRLPPNPDADTGVFTVTRGKQV